MAVLRPFTAHYARYEKASPGGHELIQQDRLWRHYSYSATAVWASAFTSMALLSLVSDGMDGWEAGGWLRRRRPRPPPSPARRCYSW